MSGNDGSKVLVVFYSRYGLTERLAVLLAEGAIQGGASIRLRRCRDLMPEETIAADPDWKANRDRMQDEFAAPRIQDVVWADVIAFGTPAGPAATSTELSATLAQIAQEVPGEVLAGKGATAFTSTYDPRKGAELSVSDLQRRLLQLGFVTLPAPGSTLKPRSTEATGDYEAARVHGRVAASLGKTMQLLQESTPAKMTAQPD